MPLPHTSTYRRHVRIYKAADRCAHGHGRARSREIDSCDIFTEVLATTLESGGTIFVCGHGDGGQLRQKPGKGQLKVDGFAEYS